LARIVILGLRGFDGRAGGGTQPNEGLALATLPNAATDSGGTGAGVVQDLKHKTIRGGAAKLVGHGARAAVRLGTLMVLARLLDPSDFGLVAMATAVTGIFEVFATGGLSIATIQRVEISHAQVSTLFWCNVAIGALLALLCFGAAPIVGVFYDDTRTALVICAVAPAFLINATGVQHLAMLQRELRYTTLAVIEVTSEVIAAVIAIGMAMSGLGYWAVVATVVSGPFVITVGAWVMSGWVPGRPRHIREVASMLRFGGAITIYGLVVYIAYNIEKVLIGRYYGSDALGLYGRAYELINLPTRIISTAVGMVAFSSLARLQAEPDRLKSYFLKGYSLFAAITIPATLACVIFAGDIILVALGPKWTHATTIFQLLAPSVLVLGVMQPVAWLLMALGLQERSLKISFVLAPIVISSYLIGLPYGPAGVALAFSTAMVLWLVPHVVWSLRGTSVSALDVFSAASRPALAAVLAGLVALSVQALASSISIPIVRLALGGTIMLAVYAFVLLVVLRQNDFYFDLVRGLRSAELNSGRIRVERPRLSSLPRTVS
jgi:O-antigen/teichoic acid export membrane protein